MSGFVKIGRFWQWRILLITQQSVICTTEAENALQNFPAAAPSLSVNNDNQHAKLFKFEGDRKAKSGIVKYNTRTANDPSGWYGYVKSK